MDLHGQHERAMALLRQGELADAIGAFLRTLEAHPEYIPAYFGLMRAYELTFEVLPDPELLHQVKNVLRGLRDQDLGEAETREADVIERAVDAKLARAGSPPPAPGRTTPG
jgi:hypothetical protein